MRKRERGVVGRIEGEAQFRNSNSSRVLEKIRDDHVNAWGENYLD